MTPQYKRRTVYAKVSRYKLDEYLQLFDFPSPAISAEKRFTTTVPLQRLFLMNSHFVQLQSEELVKRVAGEADNRSRIRWWCAGRSSGGLRCARLAGVESASGAGAMSERIGYSTLSGASMVCAEPLTRYSRSCTARSGRLACAVTPAPEMFTCVPEPA